MTKPNDVSLLEKQALLLSITQAILGSLELDQILYVILSAITHRNGLHFNRAFLFTASEDSRELRAFTAVGPPDETEAPLVWQDQEKQQPSLDTLLNSYQVAFSDPKAHSLAKRLTGFIIPLPQLPHVRMF